MPEQFVLISAECVCLTVPSRTCRYFSNCCEPAELLAERRAIKHDVAMKTGLLALLALCLAASGCDDDDAQTSDSGATDSGSMDGGQQDSGSSDSGSSDSGLSDSGLSDSGLADTGAPDTGVTDAGLSESQICIDTCQASLACNDDSEVGVCTVYCDTSHSELETAGCADELAAVVTCQRGLDDICDPEACLDEGYNFRVCMSGYCNSDAGVEDGACVVFQLTYGCDDGPWKC